MLAQDIIIKPIVTEKSMMGIADKKYTFEVAKAANKLKLLRQLKSCLRLRFQRLIQLICVASSAVRADTRATQEAGRRLM